MEYIHVDEIPELNDPLFVLAFEGWNDAAQSATIAARYLVSRFDGKRFARFQSEDFFQFSDQRPHVRLGTDGKRVITWPENSFYYCKHPELARDLVVCVGVEPQLMWKSFSRSVMELIRRCGSGLTVTMGGLLAENPHDEPLELVCIATEPRLAGLTGVQVTKYEGPTGIVGVIHTELQDARIPAVSLWVNIPQKISSLPNPKGAYALLERLEAVSKINIDLDELGRSADQFDEKVKEVIEQQPSNERFLSQPFTTQDDGDDMDTDPLEDESAEEESPEKLPSGDELADEIESFLRRRSNGEASD
ncbi:MAG: hypothetical protein CMH76_05520 [Nitrospinae bacterium]|nr:hypothetical protein [Nitrospinota bacterium]